MFNRGWGREDDGVHPAIPLLALVAVVAILSRAR